MDRHAVIENRAVEIALVEIRLTPLLVSGGYVRIQPDGLTVSGNRFFHTIVFGVLVPANHRRHDPGIGRVRGNFVIFGNLAAEGGRLHAILISGNVPLGIHVGVAVKLQERHLAVVVAPLPIGFAGESLQQEVHKHPVAETGILYRRFPRSATGKR